MTRISTSEALDFFRGTSGTGAAPDPLDVLRFGQHLLSGGNSSSVSAKDRFEILEQCFIAALDTHNGDLAKTFLRQIEAKFPRTSSSRTKRLVGLIHESNQEWSLALETYAEILAVDDTNQLVHKRIIAVSKGRGNIPEAISKLVEYLNVFATDLEAWMELSDLYRDENCLGQAAYCVEECMLLQPLNQLYCLRYGEIMEAMDDGKTAVKYYCRVLELVPKYPPAVLALTTVLDKILNTDKDSNNSHSESAKSDKSDEKRKSLVASSDSTLSSEDRAMFSRLAELLRK